METKKLSYSKSFYFFLLSILYILILSFDKCTNLVEVLPKTIGKQHHWWWLEQLHFFQWIVLWEQSSRLWVVSILYILIHLPLLSFDKCTDLMELTRSSLWLKLLHWSQWILLLSGVLFSFHLVYSNSFDFLLSSGGTIEKHPLCWWLKLLHCSRWILPRSYKVSPMGGGR